ncbi:hypothetical protein ACX818_001386 [Acinetobacter baumannii]
MKHIAQLILLAVWITGIVLAKGFWWTLGAIVFPPISWYIVISEVLKNFGFIS